MIDRILNTINKNCMFQSGDKVIVAVSGGPDSICLLHVMHTLRKQLNIELIAAHVNHGLRGKEADEDEAYAKELCDFYGIGFFSRKIDIVSLAKEKGVSLELAGREARYDFFMELITKLKGNKIALAHNANDQAETILMRIIRGTGLEGLVGIKAVRDEIFVRPIIEIYRHDIENYCNENNLKMRIDRTNLENIYTRNKVRLELIPFIEKNFNVDFLNTLNRMSDTLKKDNEYMDSVSEEAFKKLCEIKKDKIIMKKELFHEKEAIVARTIRLSINKLSGNTNNIEKIHIYDIIKIHYHNTGKYIELPNNLTAVNNYGDINLQFKEDKYLPDKKEYKIELNSCKVMDDFKIKITTAEMNKTEDKKLKDYSFVKHFDRDKIKGDITLRYRKEGDRIIPLGMNGSKKVKDIFIDMKIPKDERDRIPIICFGGEIAWIFGVRISESFKVDKNTENILEISIEAGR